MNSGSCELENDCSGGEYVDETVDLNSESEHLDLVCTPDISFHAQNAESASEFNLQNQRCASAMDMCPQMMGFGMMPVSKRKHKVLSLEDKIELLKKIEAGESVTSLATFYNVGRATIFDIKAKKESILSFASKLKNEDVLKTRKTLRTPSKKLKNLFKDCALDEESASLQDSPDLSVRGSKVQATETCDLQPSNSELVPSGDDLVSSSGDFPPLFSDVQPSSSDIQSSSTDAPQNSNIWQSGLDFWESDCPDVPETGSAKEIKTSKRKHIVLSIEAKIEIIQRLDKGETGTSLAPLYNVGRATISDIKNKRESILMFASKLKSEDGLKKRKTMRKANDTSLEDAVYMWYVQKINQGDSVNGPKICEKALELNSKLGGPPDFKASTGWLKNFRSRHGIKHIQGDRDTFTCESSAASSYLIAYLNLLQQEGYHRDDIYSADEAVIDWQAMPRNSEVFRCTQEELNNKHEPITVLLCANSSWNHALPLLVVGKRSKREYFKRITCFPVAYKRQRNGWMDSEIFMSWYANDFIPAVRKEREVTGKCGKVLLLLDNAPFHPVVDMLNRVDENFKVMFLPSNLTASAHPMDQGAIKKLKRVFKTDVLRRLLLAQNDVKTVVERVKKLSLKECCHMLADGWKNLSQENMKEAIDKPWAVSERLPDQCDPVDHEKDWLEVVELFEKVPGFSKCSILDAREWLIIDAGDPGNKILDEDEIVTSVRRDEISENEEDDYLNSDLDQDVPDDDGPSHTQAFHAFQTAMGWCEQQRDCCPEELLFLKRLRDLAAKKSWIVSSGVKYLSSSS